MMRSILTLAIAMMLAAPAFAQEAAPAADPAAVDPVAVDPVAAPVPESAPVVEPVPEAAPTTEVNVTQVQETPAPVADAGVPPEEPPPCVLGELCFGPVLTLGLINPLGIGVHARYGEYVGFGLDYQFLPTLSLGDAEAGISLFTVDGRFYPFGGAFFLSGGIAFQSASFSATAMDASGATTKIEGDISVPAFKLGLGFMGHDGFVMGIDLALEIPLGSSDVEIDTNGASGPDVIKASNEIEDAADTAVNLLPVMFQLNLIRIGYLF